MKEPDDKPLFSRAMTRLFAIYGDELTPALLHAWWGALEEFPIEDVMAAMNLHAKDPKAGMFRPTPAHLMAHLTETLPRERRLQRSLRRQQLALAIAPHDEAIRRAYTDVKLEVLSLDEAQVIVQREKAEIVRITAMHTKALEHDRPE